MAHWSYSNTVYNIILKYDRSYPTTTTTSNDNDKYNKLVQYWSALYKMFCVLKNPVNAIHPTL